jgi:TolA-binding protein
MTQLEPNAAAALQALAVARTPAAGASDRAWALLQARIVDGPPPIDAELPVRASVGRSRWLAYGIALAAVVVAAVSVASWNAGRPRGDDGESPGAAGYSTTPEDIGSQDVVAPSAGGSAAIDQRTDAVAEILNHTAAVELPAARDTDAPTSSGTRPRARRSATRVEPAAKPSDAVPAQRTTLAAELRLLARANTAMRTGDPAAALAVLDRHAREFPAGQLAPEREYKRALALCELGRTERAREVAETFVRAHPDSPLRAKASSVCR